MTSPAAPHTSIFFDLETTDLEPIGQILNFSFIAVDDHWNVGEELSGSVKISRLQLPRVAAILANRVNVYEHQSAAPWSELKAMEAISGFIHSVIEKHPVRTVPFIGFNSSKFDLLHLRTAMIRNGINPYWPVVYRDVLQIAQTLQLIAPKFEEFRRQGASARGCEPSLRLEFLAHCAGLLEGAQLHESRADVLLTIALARALNERFGLDVRTFSVYQGRAFHCLKRPVVVRGARLSAHPEWRPYALHQANDRSALWIDLNRYRECADTGDDPRAALCWITCTTQGFLVDRVEEDPALRACAVEASEVLSKTTLDNYFAASTCDIEQFIYRISPGEIKSLAEHRTARKYPERWNNDMRTLMLRHRLANYELGGANDDAMREALRSYAIHRYGGKLQIAKTLVEGAAIEGQFHPTYARQWQEIEEALRVELPQCERSCVEALRRFYLESELLAVAGPELMTQEEVRDGSAAVPCEG